MKRSGLSMRAKGVGEEESFFPKISVLLLEKHLHDLRLKCYSNIRTFYAKLLQISSYKFYHATENNILSISLGGATFQTTSSLRTEADFFSKILGLTRVWSTFFFSPQKMWTRPGPDPKFWKKVGLCTKWGSGLKSRAPGGYTQNFILCRMVKLIRPYLK